MYNSQKWLQSLATYIPHQAVPHRLQRLCPILLQCLAEEEADQRRLAEWRQGPYRL